jgi:hypothetical protein
MKAPEIAPPFFRRRHLNEWVYACLKFLLPIGFEYEIHHGVGFGFKMDLVWKAGILG